MKYNDYPIAECVEQVAQVRKANPNAKAYQKFTCEKCGQRLTMEEPNVFFESGACDKCGHVTDIAKNGCNWRLVFSV